MLFTARNGALSEEAGMEFAGGASLTASPSC
jgi:hypothetical protein